MSELKKFVEEGNVAELRAWLEKNAPREDGVDIRDFEDWELPPGSSLVMEEIEEALFAATTHERPDCVAAIVELCPRAAAGMGSPDQNDWWDEGLNGETALMLAAGNGNDPEALARCFDLLLPVSDLDALNLSGQSVLTRAAENGNLRAVKILMERSDPLHVDSSSVSALMFAAFNGHADCVRALMPVSDANHQEGADGRNALMLAAFRGHAACVEILAPTTDLAAIDALGRTAFGLAVEMSSWACADALASVENPELGRIVKEAGNEKMPRAAALLEAKELGEEIAKRGFPSEREIGEAPSLRKARVF